MNLSLEELQAEVTRMEQRLIKAENDISLANNFIVALQSRILTLEEARKKQIVLNSELLKGTSPQVEDKPWYTKLFDKR